MPRPKYPRPDRRQRECINELKSRGCVIVETHRLGGNALDFLVIRPDFKRCVLVEFKNSLGESFTNSEIKMLNTAGIWRRPGPFSPPEDCVVMAAWRSFDIFEQLEMIDRCGRFKRFDNGDRRRK